MIKKLYLYLLLTLPLFTVGQQQQSINLSATRDVMIREFNGSCDGNNYNTVQYINMHSWTNGGNLVNQYSLIDFNLNTIPVSANIFSAYLKLFVDMNVPTFPGGHSTLSGSNQCDIVRVSSPWNENNIIWSTQPSTTNQNLTIINQSTSANQNYTIDVTNLVQDMINNPATSFGFLIKLSNSNYYRRMIFASSNNVNEQLHPVLSVNFGNDNTTETWDCVNGNCIDFGTGTGLYLDSLICQSQCGATNISEIKSNKNLINIIDLLGKEVGPNNNTFLLYIYEDGTVEKKITIE